MAPKPALSRSSRGAPTERRLHSRLAINCEVCLSWQDPEGNHTVRARALDMSKYGMLVESESGIAPGVVVSVGTSSAAFGSACVRHCAPTGATYLIGLHMPDRMTALMVSMDGPIGGTRR